MSDQDDPSESALDQAIAAILGRTEISESDPLLPIERQNLRQYLGEQRHLFATASRAAIRGRMQEEQKRLEAGIAHLPLGHPHREKPEARIAELTAELDVRPLDCAGISIETAICHPSERNLSITEKPAEAARPSRVLGTTKQSNGRPAEGDTAPGAQGPNATLKPMKPLRRNEKYERIDGALREFAAAQ